MRHTCAAKLCLQADSRQREPILRFANAKLPLMDVKPHLVISQKMPIIADEWQNSVQT